MPETLPELVDKGGKAWRPNHKQQAYLDCWLDPSKPKTVAAICRELGISRRVYYQWRAHGAFAEWFNRMCKAETEHLAPALLNRYAQLAMQGSVEHGKLLALIRGDIRSADQPGAGQAHGGVTVIIGVPRGGDPVSIPEDRAFPSLPGALVPEVEQ